MHPIHLTVTVSDGQVNWRLYSTRHAAESGPLWRWQRWGQTPLAPEAELSTTAVLEAALADVLSRLT